MPPVHTVCVQVQVCRAWCRTDRAGQDVGHYRIPRAWGGTPRVTVWCYFHFTILLYLKAEIYISVIYMRWSSFLPIGHHDILASRLRVQGD